METSLAIYLAQGAEVAEQGISLIQMVLSGGVPLICLAIASLCAYAFYKQLTRNNTLEKDFRTKIETSADTELTRQEALLREMLTRDKDATESTSAAIQAVEGYSHSLNAQQLAFEALKLAFEGQGREIRDLRDKVGSMEETIRSFRNA